MEFQIIVVVVLAGIEANPDVLVGHKSFKMINGLTKSSKYTLNSCAGFRV